MRRYRSTRQVLVNLDSRFLNIVQQIPPSRWIAGSKWKFDVEYVQKYPDLGGLDARGR